MITLTFFAPTWQEIQATMQTVLEASRINAKADNPIMPKDKRSCDQDETRWYCANCGAYLPDVYFVLEGVQFFCDKDCKDIFYEEAAKVPRQEPCTIIPKGQVFHQDEAIKQVCAYCGKPIEDANGRQFCSTKCQCDFIGDPTKGSNSPLFHAEGPIIPEHARSSQERSQDESCAYCKQSLDGITAYRRNSQSFCCTRCADLYDEGLIPLDQRSKQERVHRQILAYVRDIARDQAKRPVDILADLKRFYGVVLFPSELAGYLTELDEGKD